MQKSKNKAQIVLKLKETHPDEQGRTTETATMFRLWSLLSDDDGVRDMTVGPRNII
ncbi:MAG: hypothetical protein KC448_03560 [Yoonia sp.]|nr:hypothetical protein [Yoonia sp.]